MEDVLDKEEYKVSIPSHYSKVLLLFKITTGIILGLILSIIIYQFIPLSYSVFTTMIGIGLFVFMISSLTGFVFSILSILKKANSHETSWLIYAGNLFYFLIVVILLFSVIKDVTSKFNILN